MCFKDVQVERSDRPKLCFKTVIRECSVVVCVNAATHSSRTENETPGLSVRPSRIILSLVVSKTIYFHSVHSVSLIKALLGVDSFDSPQNHVSRLLSYPRSPEGQTHDSDHSNTYAGRLLFPLLALEILLF
ncbi:hypothetical protein VTK73DRAFT_412 [Phialemonium thermophilum]|uniref:Uncharacterized protein n=1 Tax=Phialemonium thermophilum TaxID=223376 RepID=A0ABR3XEI8_9PEZI